ncbi:unnamed protein product [Urochloa humidicola]
MSTPPFPFPSEWLVGAAPPPPRFRGLRFGGSGGGDAVWGRRWQAKSDNELPVPLALQASPHHVRVYVHKVSCFGGCNAHATADRGGPEPRHQRGAAAAAASSSSSASPAVASGRSGEVAWRAYARTPQHDDCLPPILKEQRQGEYRYITCTTFTTSQTLLHDASTTLCAAIFNGAIVHKIVRANRKRVDDDISITCASEVEDADDHVQNHVDFRVP